MTTVKKSPRSSFPTRRRLASRNALVPGLAASEFHSERRLCRRDPFLGEVPEGAVEAPSGSSQRIMVSSILQRCSARTAWGTFAGMMVSSPAAVGTSSPPMTRTTWPSRTCTTAS